MRKKRTGGYSAPWNQNIMSVIGQVKSYSFGALEAKNEGWQKLIILEHSVIYQIRWNTVVTFNSGQNYLRKFSPSCPLSYGNKTISRTTYCGQKTPSPNSMLLPTNAQGSGFLLNTQQHCFQGKGEREEPVQLRCLEKCCPSIKFSQQFYPRL